MSGSFQSYNLSRRRRVRLAGRNNSLDRKIRGKTRHSHRSFVLQGIEKRSGVPTRARACVCSLINSCPQISPRNCKFARLRSKMLNHPFAGSARLHGSVYYRLIFVEIYSEVNDTRLLIRARLCKEAKNPLVSQTGPFKFDTPAKKTHSIKSPAVILRPL